MGKRSQAKHKWLSMSQRIKDGPGKSGARLWYRVAGLGGQARPGTPRTADRIRERLVGTTGAMLPPVPTKESQYE